MIKKSLLVLLLGLSISSAFTQTNDEILLEVGPEKITVDEFLHIYKKNNKIKNENYNLDSLKSYMDMFVNFKLKVAEAKEMGIDTIKSFKTELKGYKDQLAKPYLVDKEIQEELIKEAYQRKTKDLNVSHILIKVDPDADPQDTIKAYKKIKEIREKVTNGEDFEELAVKYSEDKSIDKNKGNIGWTTVFGMLYPFETEAYNTPVGEISDIVRTRFGYHIIKVNDERPAKGRIRTAHIMVLVPQDANEEEAQKAKEKIENIKKKLENGQNFIKLAQKHSEDRKSARNGGLLPWFEVGGRMIPDYENAAYKLEKPGEISDIIKTDYGYHIIQLVEKDPVGTFEEEKAAIKKRLRTTDRAQKARDAKVKQLNEKYKTKEYVKNFKEVASTVTDTIYWGGWDPSDALKMKKPVYKVEDSTVYQKDFANYLKKYNRKLDKRPLDKFLNEKFEEFKANTILDYEKQKLEGKYPKFHYLMKEYHDGILLFNITDKMVWSKAIEDTAGLKKFFKKNQDKYQWKKRYFTKVVKPVDKETSEKVANYLKENPDKGWHTVDSIFNPGDKIKVVKTIWGQYEVGKNKKVEKLVDQHAEELEKKSKIMDVSDNKIVYIEMREAGPKNLKEAKGLVTADYQNYLEDKWMEKLHNKYKVDINYDLLEKIAKNK